MKKLLAVLLAVLMLVPVISLGASAAYKENNNFDVIYPELSVLESDEEIYPIIILPVLTTVNTMWLTKML